MKSNSTNIKFSKSVPVWIRKLVTKTHSLFVPEWKLHVSMKKLPDCYGSFTSMTRYLTGYIEFDPILRDNTEGRVVVIHEVLHPFLQNLSSAVELFATMNEFKAGKIKEGQNFSPATLTLLNNYDTVEENTIQRLAVVLERLI